MTQGADSNLPGWQPKEKEAQLPQQVAQKPWGGQLPLVSKRYSRTSVGKRYCTKGRGPKDPSARRGRAPRTLASRRHWLLQVVAATAGVMDGLDLSIFHVLLAIALGLRWFTL